MARNALLGASSALVMACLFGCGDDGTAGAGSGAATGSGTAGGTAGSGGAGGSSSAGGAGPGERALAITITPANMPNSSAQDTSDAVGLALGAGCNGIFNSFTWSSLEPSPGALDFAELGPALELQQSAGLSSIFLSVWVINTTVKETPSDLATVAFDDPEMKARFHALIDALAPQLEGRVQYLGIGNEVDVFLSSNGNWAAYQAFFEDGVAYVHEKLPGVKVGTSVTLGGALAHSAEVKALTAQADVAIFTNYALAADLTALGPAHGGDDLDTMVMLAEGKPVVVQELGYPDAALLSSSEQDQALFVANALARWRVIGGEKMPFLSFFMMHDFSQTQCDDYASYYGLGGNERFSSYLCSLGLRHNDGSAKPAWNAFVDGAAATGF